MNTSNGRFKLVTAQVLDDRHLRRLAGGDVAAVRIPSLLPDGACRQTISALEVLPRELYDVTRVHPPIVRFGPALNDHRTDDDIDPLYWTLASSARTAWLHAELSPDPMRSMLKVLSTAWNQKVEVATIDARPTFAGVIREINAGTLVHNDSIAQELRPDILDQQISAQLALNVYLSVGASGGATTIWRRRWRPEDEASRISYGHKDIVVADAQSVTVSPAVGDALLFNSEYYHAVSPIRSGRRVSIAFFVGITCDDQLIVWS
ncbi:2OG-Fe(II) oxygenase [Streptosporangiaceae bacterium NEAU-GS5]|nr:2OG-Fe(II) oxygenase [Streptosporangiaceae bacterium NEAU-GS5]